MEWYELAGLILGAGGLGGLIATIAGVVRDHRKSKSEQKSSAIEQTKETVDLVDGLLQKQLKWMSDRMDEGESVRRKEFQELKADIGGQLTDIQAENRSQNETIAVQNDLLQDIKEYLNGGFAEFENRKHGIAKKSKKK